MFGRRGPGKTAACRAQQPVNLKGDPKGYAIQSEVSLVLISLGWVNS